MGLLPDRKLEMSSVVANCAMNRERTLTGSNGYGRELGMDLLTELRGRTAGSTGPVRWLDLCCGSGRALTEAAKQLSTLGLADRVEIVGVDLVDYFAAAPHPAVQLVTASVTAWTPPAGHRFDVITCVHGLHYVGDKLSVLSRVPSWLTADGIFAANLDTAGIRRADGNAMGRPLTAALRRAGFTYDTRNRRITYRSGGNPVNLPFTYLGADDTAGPNYTGQPTVNSHYTPTESPSLDEAAGKGQGEESVVVPDHQHVTSAEQAARSDVEWHECNAATQRLPHP
ncbi:class I SAM-dependent methyltransferase [Micromonospora sp. NPDC047465]|uniref:class I SAM-dependent methyltransferase n=1 Tax=Micromonospora sp. NPDC047465 TaxID=3154813 RepID=UPI003410AFC2